MKALAVTAGIVFWTLVLGTAWMLLFPGGDAGEPIAVLQIEPSDIGGGEVSDAPGGVSSGGVPGTSTVVPQTGDFALPPGFAVTDPSSAPAPTPPPGQGTTLAPPAPGDGVPALPSEEAPAPLDLDEQGAAPDAKPERSAAAPDPGTAAPKTPDTSSADASKKASADLLSEGSEETGAIPLPPVPVAALVEESQYGPLPKVATDGRRPAEVYARPSRYAEAALGKPVRVALLVNGLGVPDAPDSDVLKGLPAPISVAYGAYGRSLQELVAEARASGHEVLLQIPLEPENYPTEDPGPHTLLTTLPTEENLKRLQWVMSRYTGYVGVTNHMGAKFEATRASLLPVLEELKRRGLIFINDGTSKGSTAGQIAGTLGLDYSAANVQIDAESASEIAAALARLEAVARERGAAIGVAKARPAILKQIADWADGLEAKGIVLVPVSAAVRSQRQS